MSEDVLTRTRQENPDLQIDYSEDIFNEVLIIIEDKVIDTIGKTLQDKPSPSNKKQRQVVCKEKYLKKPFTTQVILSIT
uniref:Uncharacterized protein n=1 Tax=Arion vulgaris TaxID=1028688 RepID=A0A0B7AFC5_9EUPU